VWRPSRDDGKFAVLDNAGNVHPGPLLDEIECAIIEHSIDVLILDPFIKLHGVDENSNAQIDGVIGLLADLALDYRIAVDMPHHVRKGGGDAGDSDMARGASAFRDAIRLAYTLNPMTKDEAETFNVDPRQRKRYVRMDSAKVNIAPAAEDARWFELHSVGIRNGTDEYPEGDHLQVADVWEPIDPLKFMSPTVRREILDAIDAGLPGGVLYSGAPNARDRAAWQVIKDRVPELSAKQCRRVIRDWLASSTADEYGLLFEVAYDDPKERKAGKKGVRVNWSKCV
jgi:hypothetical protein